MCSENTACCLRWIRMHSKLGWLAQLHQSKQDKVMHIHQCCDVHTGQSLLLNVPASVDSGLGNTYIVYRTLFCNQSNLYNGKFPGKKHVLFSLHSQLCFSPNSKLEKSQKYSSQSQSILKYLSLIKQDPINSLCGNRMKQFICVMVLRPQWTVVFPV